MAQKNHSLKVGRFYFIRTVTHYFTGRLKAITETDLLLGDAAWVACTKRFADTLRTGELEEVEPYPDEVIVSRGAVVDISHWAHALPREQK